jgi:hypothetical protein
MRHLPLINTTTSYQNDIFGSIIGWLAASSSLRFHYTRTLARRLQCPAGMKTKTKIKAGGVQVNHNQTVRLRIKSGVKAGLSGNHNQTRGLRIKCGVKAGGATLFNHNQTRGLRIKSSVKAGGGNNYAG